MPAEPAAARRRRPNRSRVLRVAAALTSIGLAASSAGCGEGGSDDQVVTGVVADSAAGLNGSTIPDGWQLPPVQLEDTEGETVRPARAARAPLTLVFFGYTHCPDICLAVMSDIASALNRLPEQEAEQVEVWFVTTDPQRDDGPTVRAWLDRFDPSFRGFTGDLAAIEDLATAVNVPIEEGRKLPTGGYEVTHGTPILGVVPGGQARMVWTEGTSSAKLAEDLHSILVDPELMEQA